MFLNVSGKSAEVSAGPGTSPFIGAALVAPIALYGLWLIRKRQFQFVVDEVPDVTFKPVDTHAARKVYS